MSKQCLGKYHGSGIKYINDNENYCRVCKQHMDLNKKRVREGIMGGLAVVGGIVAAILGINSKNKKIKHNKGA